MAHGEADRPGRRRQSVDRRLMSTCNNSPGRSRSYRTSTVGGSRFRSRASPAARHTLALRPRVGHRITRRRSFGSPKQGFEFVYVATDDFTRLFYVDVLADERSEAASSFLTGRLGGSRRKRSLSNG